MTSNYDVYRTAEHEGWSREVKPYRVRDIRLTVYRKGDKVIRVESIPEGGGITYCDRYQGEGKGRVDAERHYTYRTSRDRDKAATVVRWMTHPWV